MSWDLYVMHLPSGVTDVKDIPDDYEAPPLASRSEIIQKIQEFEPAVDFTDPTWGVFDHPDFSVEFNLGSGDLVDSMALHVRGGDVAIAFIAEILKRVGCEAIDPQSDSGIFSIASATESLKKWREYRDQALSKPAT